MLLNKQFSMLLVVPCVNMLFSDRCYVINILFKQLETLNMYEKWEVSEIQFRVKRTNERSFQIRIMFATYASHKNAIFIARIKGKIEQNAYCTCFKHNDMSILKCLNFYVAQLMPHIENAFD